MNKHYFHYILLRIFTYPLKFLPFWLIHTLGKFLGFLSFYFVSNFRKRTLSNIALAKDLKFSNKEILKTAKKSFQNLCINLLEYPLFFYKKNFKKVIVCKNFEKAQKLYDNGTGIIFFCGHQSNWEVLFLDGTTKMRGIAIGKPIKNPYLYNWIISIREKFGGRIIPPRKALKESLRSLRKGIFLGIVGDQSMPDSNYSYPFLGRRAWTSTAPALLAYKTKSPIIVATTKRVLGGYEITYSEPIWPNFEIPTNVEVPRLMNESLKIFEQSVSKNPEEWMWQHNRYKQQTPENIFKEYRFDSILIILPEEEEKFLKFSKIIKILKKIYFRDFIFIFSPKKYKKKSLIDCEEVFYYKDVSETLVKDYRFKLVFNFTNFTKIQKFYKKLSAFDVLSIDRINKLASNKNIFEKDFSKKLLKLLCREKAHESINAKK